MQEERARRARKEGDQQQLYFNEEQNEFKQLPDLNSNGR